MHVQKCDTQLFWTIKEPFQPLGNDLGWERICLQMVKSVKSGRPPASLGGTALNCWPYPTLKLPSSVQRLFSALDLSRCARGIRREPFPSILSL